MSKKIKLKDLLEENFSGTMLGGVVSKTPFHNDISLSKLVKEKYGDVEEEKVDIKGLTNEISNFNSLSKNIFGKSNIKNVAEKLSWIAKQAHSHTLQETEDWFDKITVNRNMKELIGLSNNFGKIASEAQSLQERMGALYEDMGNILSRYYDIKEDATDYALHGREGDEVDDEDNAEVKEVEGDKAEYEKFFRAALKKFGVSEPDKLPDDKKKEFYNYIDANWKGDTESD
jgi:hypothetical protein